MVKVGTYLELFGAAKNDKDAKNILIEAARAAYAEKSQYWNFITVYSSEGYHCLLGPNNCVVTIENLPKPYPSAKPWAQVSVESLEKYVSELKSPEGPENFIKNLDRGISPIGAAGKTGLKANYLEDIVKKLRDGTIKAGHTTPVRRRL